ncbi:MAG: hypothetical protein HYR55_07510 [Acidobacteria bacterium]|nr:hypothetical protein [Acidobacteriota bacterium]
MKKLGGLLGLVIALGIGYYLFQSQYNQGPTGSAPPKQVIDVAGVKMDLLAMGQAERTYLVSHGTYGTIDQLHREGSLSFSGTNHRGYNYSAEVDDGRHFKIIAKPSDPEKQSWPTVVIDETLQISQP